LRLVVAARSEQQKLEAVDNLVNQQAAPSNEH
jgi:hypothetical protein